MYIENKNEKLELGTCGINDPWFYREVRCESGADFAEMFKSDIWSGKYFCGRYNYALKPAARKF